MPARKLPLLMVTADQLAPPVDVRNSAPKSPTATHAAVLEQLMALIGVEMPVVCAAQFEPALVVARTPPSDDPAKQVLVLGQLMASSALPFGSGFCQLQVPPAVNVSGLV